MINDCCILLRSKTVFLRFFLGFLYVFSLTFSSEAQDQTTFTAYYPTAGAWRTIRVLPSTGCTFGSTCPNQGEFCYSSTDQTLFFCDNTNTWQTTGRWTRIGNDVYYLDDVSIGMEHIGDRLSVQGSTNLCVSRKFSASTGFTNCPWGYFIVIPEGTAAARPGYTTYSWGLLGEDYYMCCRTCSAPDNNNNGICDD